VDILNKLSSEFYFDPWTHHTQLTSFSQKLKKNGKGRKLRLLDLWHFLPFMHLHWINFFKHFVLVPYTSENNDLYLKLFIFILDRHILIGLINHNNCVFPSIVWWNQVQWVSLWLLSHWPVIAWMSLDPPVCGPNRSMGLQVWWPQCSVYRSWKCSNIQVITSF